MARNLHHRNSRQRKDSAFDHPAMSYQPPKQLRRFRTAMALVVSVLLVGGLWTGLWFGASNYVQSLLDDWVHAQAAQANVAGYESVELAGFPSRIILTITNPHYLGPVAGLGIAGLGIAGLDDAARTVSWKGETLTLSTRPWMPWHLHADLAGQQELKAVDGSFAVAGTAARLSADFVPGGTWPERLALDLQGLDLRGSANVSMDALTVNWVYDAAVKAGGDGLRLTLTGSNWNLPLVGGFGLGDTVQTLETALRVTGPVQPGPLGERLTQWRDVGGAVQVESLKARVGPLAVAASGTFALDGQMQPIGAFSAKIEGLFQVLEILRAQGVVSGSDSVMATMALAAMSRRSADGGPASINLAVSVQDRKLTLGTIQLLELPSIDWGLTSEAAEAEADKPPVRDYKDVPPIY